jgi:hypothetical protein
MDAIVEQALTEKIQRQQRFIDELEEELRQARRSSVEMMLGELRLREAILLYVGQDANNFVQQIAQAFGSAVAGSVSASLFMLDNAPVPPDVRDALRAACHHGMSRW